MLARAADEDVSVFRAELRGHHKVLQALRQTQIEQGQKIDTVEQEMRNGFAQVNAGIQQITELLQRHLDTD